MQFSVVKVTLGHVVSEKFVFPLSVFSVMTRTHHKYLVLNINLNGGKSGQRLETVKQSNNFSDIGKRWAQQHSHFSQLSTIEHKVGFPFHINAK